MRFGRWIGWLAAGAIACGGSASAPRDYADALAAAEAEGARLEAEAARAEAEAAKAEEAASRAAAEAHASAEPAPDAVRPATPPRRTTKSYEQAMSAPESIALDDTGVQLSDDQLTTPMRGVVDRCRVPSTAKVTIRVAVQNGRATGVTVQVQMAPASPSGKATRTSKAAARKAAAAARTANAIKRCVDHTVRALSWPASGRRDSFTTTF